MKTKSQTFNKFLEFQQLVEKESDKPIKMLQSNRVGEFLSTTFINYLKNKGISHQLTMAWTPQQNGIAERRNYMIIERA